MRYIGESARSLPKRVKEHLGDVLNKNKRSQIRDHLVTEHPNKLDQVEEVFNFTILKLAKSALVRQIREALEISLT